MPIEKCYFRYEALVVGVRNNITNLTLVVRVKFVEKINGEFAIINNKAVEFGY